MAKVGVETVVVFWTFSVNLATCFQYPFQDPARSWMERVDDLVQRLTLDEIAAQMAQGGRTTHAPGISRLGVQPYPWGAECSRGDVQAGPATSFPQAIGLAATFSEEVLFDVSRATGLEVRAKFNNFSRHGDYGTHTSASCWSPVINIMRDPRWGRNQETYGEDPLLSGRLAAAFVRGLQGNHPRYVMANAGCKHFDVYGGPENIPTSRFSFDAKVSEFDWRMTFLPAFKMCVDAGSLSLMCSFNKINGVPSCANRKLLTDILRGEWGFNGYVISDEGAIEDIQQTHNYTHNVLDTIAAAVTAGTNLEDGPQGLDMPFYSFIADAVHAGKLSEYTVREAVKPLFYTRMRLGLFDPTEMNPYAQLRPEVYVQSRRHRELSLLTAMRSFVLLKNQNNFLPLKPGKAFDTVAIIGPMADNVDGVFGGYAPDPDPRYVVTPLKGLQTLGRNVRYHPGCNSTDTGCLAYDAQIIQATVKGSDVIVVCLGTGFNIEAEGNDRPNISLPGRQLEVLKTAVNAANEKPVLLFLFNAGPLDITWAKNNVGVDVIMECFFPAQAAGEALRRVVYAEGTASNPGGRLPATWPADLTQVPPITDYTMRGRTYRYFEGVPLYPFGYGLSYSAYRYRSLEVRPSTLRYGDSIVAQAYVQNTGPLDGEEVVQVYISWKNATSALPKLQLVGFHRYFIASGTGITCQFRISVEQFSVWSEKSKGLVLQPGEYMLYLGGQQPYQLTNVGSNVLQSTLTVLQ